MTTATEPRVTRERLEQRYDDLMWTVERDTRSDSGWLPTPSKTWDRLDGLLQYIVAHVAGDECEQIDAHQAAGEAHTVIRERLIDAIVAALDYSEKAA